MKSAKLFNLRQEKDKEEYWHIIKKWREDWGHPPLSIKSLPEIGVMVFFNNKPVYCGWLYRTDSNIAVIGWLLSSKSKEFKKIKKGLLEFLIDTLEKTAASLDFETVLLPARNPSLISKLLTMNYNLKFADCKMTNFFKKI